MPFVGGYLDEDLTESSQPLIQQNNGEWAQESIFGVRSPRWNGVSTNIRSMFSKFKSSDLGIIAMALEEEDEERRKQRPVTRRKWVDNAWKRRTIEGEFYTLMPHLIDNETKFYEYFRMSLITFHKLLSKVEAHLHKEDTFWRQAITPKHRLAVCLR
ncbi:hypothetical protein J6590_039737 [Homalodisca vitripennis]|nr:hypothetical protein J6590_039737 [Homalodisca vitripennis]